MARTPSTMLPLGTPLPDFELPDAHGVRWSTRQARGAQATLVLFICNHCPYVKHVRRELAAIGRDYPPRGVVIVAINANDVEAYPDDSPAKMLEEARQAGYAFPYLFDETQQVAKAFRAACTPDLYLFDGAGRLVYRGQLDDSRPKNDEPVDGHDLRTALDAVLAGEPVSPDQRPSLGCNIKWRPGNEPDYFG